MDARSLSRGEKTQAGSRGAQRAQRDVAARRAAWRAEVFASCAAYCRARELGASAATLAALHNDMMTAPFNGCGSSHNDI